MTTSAPATSRYLAADASGVLSTIDAPTREAAERIAATKELHLASRDEVSGLKCGDEMMSWTPYGGAQSFGDYDRFVTAQKQSGEISELSYVFQNLVSNIMADGTLGLADKASRVSSVATELSTRVADPGADDGDEGDDDPVASGTAEHKPGILARAGRALVDALAPAAVEASGTRAASDSGENDAGGGTAGVSTPPVTTALAAATDKLLEQPDARFETEGSVFSAFKSADGSWRWAATWSNAYKDREGEAFSLAAHKDYAAWVDADKAARLPALYYYHAPFAFDAEGAPVGMGRAEAMALDEDTGIAFAAGTFSDAAVAAGIPQKLKERADAGELGVSHGYHYPLSGFKDGVFNKFRTYEISPLPRWAEANDLTSFLVAEGEKGRTMTFSAAKRKELVDVLGESQTAAAEAFLTKLGTAAKDAGLGVKEIAVGMIDALEAGEPGAVETPAPQPFPSMGELIAGLMPTLTAGLKEAAEAATAPLADKIAELTGKLETIETKQKDLEGALPTSRVPFYLASRTGGEPSAEAKKEHDDQAAPPSGTPKTGPGGLDPFYATPAAPAAAAS